MSGSSDEVTGGNVERCVSDSEFTGDAVRDCEHVSVEGNESDIEAVLDRYGAELVTTVDGDEYYRIESLERGDAEVAVVYENGDVEAMEFNDFIRNVGDGFTDTISYQDILGVDVSADIEKDIYRSGGINYHVTTVESAVEILLDGELKARNETRGVTNRSTGRAVFTSSHAPDDVYGDVVFEVDIDKMVADGFTPDAGKELPVEKAIAKESVASEFYIPDFYAETDPSISHNTEVFYDDIPLEYLHLDVDGDVVDSIRNEIEGRLDEGDISEKQYNRVIRFLESEC